MEDTEPFVYLGFLTFAVFFIGVAFMMIQGAVDSAMQFTDIESSGVNVAMSKNFYLLNQGERFGKFESGQLENMKIEKCDISLPGYIEDNPKHKVDDSCDYYEKSQREKRAENLAEEYAEKNGVELPEGADLKPRLRTLLVSGGEPKMITTVVPPEALDPSSQGGEE